LKLHRVVLKTDSGSITAGTIYVLPEFALWGDEIVAEKVAMTDATVYRISIEGEVVEDSKATAQLRATNKFKPSSPGKYIIEKDGMLFPLSVHGIAKVADRVYVWTPAPHTVKCVFGCKGSAVGNVAILPAIKFLPAVVKVDGQLRVLGYGELLLLTVVAGGATGFAASSIRQSSGQQKASSSLSGNNAPRL